MVIHKIVVFLFYETKNKNKLLPWEIYHLFGALRFELIII